MAGDLRGQGASSFISACFKKVAADGTANVLVAETGNGMLRGMRIPGAQENMEGGFPGEPQSAVVRLIRIALWRDRRRTEKLLSGLRAAVESEIGLLEERLMAKLESIDTSVSLVAGELARRGDEPQSGGAGS
ncbi:MAG: hypothetical protein ABSC23_11690 [Bryobacteraceae bacterium]